MVRIALWIVSCALLVLNSSVNFCSQQSRALVPNKQILCQAERYFKIHCYENAEKCFKKIAASDSPDPVARAHAWYSLGKMYSTGKGRSVSKNLPKAREYLSRAAKQNDNVSTKVLASTLLKELFQEQEAVPSPVAMEDNIVPLPALPKQRIKLPPHIILQRAEIRFQNRSYVIAVEKFKQVADSHDLFSRAQAWYRLGQIYSLNKGKRVPQDMVQALDYLSRAAQQNDNLPVKNLASILLSELNGEEEPADVVMEVESELQGEQAASQSHILQNDEAISPSSMFELHEAEEENNSNQIQSQQCFSETPSLESQSHDSSELEHMQLSTSSQSGSEARPPSPASRVLFDLAKLYFEGKTCRQDFKKAREYFTLAAQETRDPFLRIDAMLNIGTAYVLDGSSSENGEKAREVWESILRENLSPFTNADTQVQLGFLYCTYEALKNEYKAAMYLIPAAQQMVSMSARAEAQWLLGGIYYKSREFHRYFEESYIHLKAASEQTVRLEVATAARDLLKAMLNDASTQTQDLLVQGKARQYQQLLYGSSTNIF